jgi:hypothetical protein
MGNLCPLIQKDCVEHQCKFWINVQGVNPQPPGDVINRWDCAMAWMPVLLIENSGQTRRVQSAIESFRNEMIKAPALIMNSENQITNANEIKSS